MPDCFTTPQVTERNYNGTLGLTLFKKNSMFATSPVACKHVAWLPEVESSRTDFEVLGLGLEGQVLGLGLEASSPRKLACPRLEDSSIF